MSPSTEAGSHPPRIAVDAMGGDYAPSNVVEGVVQAVRDHGSSMEVVLVGDRQEIEMQVGAHGGGGLSLDIVHAEQQVEMAEAGAGSFRKKRDSSLNVATRLVRDGEAAGVFSAGNTGAMVAASLLNIGRLPGVIRPGIATMIPTRGQPGWAVMLDVGATADCTPTNLLQFAVLGEVYARIVLGIEQPRVGLLSIGEEGSKGNELTQQAHPLLAASGLNFVGNVEGRDILHGRADVVVTDGFTGNVLLKFAESVWTWAVGAVRREIGEHVLAKMGAWLLKPSLRRFRTRIDYSEYGGAPLLGVNGVAIIGHGKSSAKAVSNAVRIASDLVRRGVTQEILAELERIKGGKVASS
jgi:glycerol-3-phosphate acyltransferase PlsX